ncbi:MAG: hypothetical protein L3J08_04945 [Flavobacteriaceae bacterium]|nr:hypothetical protein [Flavobacteriaceae bacterium]
MKRILGAILITILVSCNSNTKAEKQLLKKENELLQRELELTKKEQKSDSKKTAIKMEEKIKPTKKLIGYTFKNFHISENSVGIFSKGMTISNIYNAIPKEQIKKKVGYGEFADKTYDDYEIYDSNGKKILILTPKQNGNTKSKITRILILDKRFKTTEKIGLNSTFGDLEKYYSIDKISPNMEYIILEINHINAWFSIKKTKLQEGWWNGSRIDKSKISKKLKFDGITIWWK